MVNVNAMQNPGRDVVLQSIRDALAQPHTLTPRNGNLSPRPLVRPDTRQTIGTALLDALACR
jgi:hypothetical protein